MFPLVSTISIKSKLCVQYAGLLVYFFQQPLIPYFIFLNIIKRNQQWSNYHIFKIYHIHGQPEFLTLSHLRSKVHMKCMFGHDAKIDSGDWLILTWFAFFVLIILEVEKRWTKVKTSAIVYSPNTVPHFYW